MAHTKVPPASFGKTEAGDKYGHPAQGVDPVDMIAGLHPAEAEAAPGADAARPRAEDNYLRPDQLPAGGQS